MASSDICETAVEKYLFRLSKDLEVIQSNNGCYLLTPFIRPDGESISLELVSLPNGNLRLSDMGDTLGYLYINGLTLTKTLLDKARLIAKGYGVSFQGNALVLDGDPSLAGDGIHNIIQSVLAVTSLIQSRRSTTRVLFDNEVESFIISVGVTYDFDYTVKGVRENHKFKFHVNSGRNLLVQPLSEATESRAHSLAERWAYQFIDTVDNNGNWNPVAVLDDRNTRQAVWSPHAQAPIYDRAVLWAERERLLGMLTG